MEKNTEKLTQPASDVSERFNPISIERDISETSQIHLKKDVFFVKPLGRFKNISKKMSFVQRL